jgi:hypothetical protein
MSEGNKNAPKTFIERLVNKGNSVQEQGNSKGKLGIKGKIILVVVALAVVAAFALRRKAIQKKRAELVKQKNDLIADLKLENRRLQNKDFAHKVDKIATSIDKKKEKVKNIKAQLRSIEDHAKAEKEALAAVNSWDAFDKHFGPS